MSLVGKMNYSRRTYFVSLCDNIIKHHKEKKNKSVWLSEIDLNKARINKRSKGYWDLTQSESAFLEFMDKLNQLLENENIFEEEIEKLKYEALQCSFDKIRLLFLTQEISVWPSLESVYLAAVADNRFDAKLVYLPFVSELSRDAVNQYDAYKNDMGLPIIKYDEYDLTEESPDVCFLNKGYDFVPVQYHIKELENAVFRMIFISYGMEITKDLAKYYYQEYLHYRAWKHCAHGNIVKKYAAKSGYKNGDNIAVWGHPKADSYLNLEEKRKLIPREWQDKINCRSVVLWTPHHMVGFDFMTNYEGTGTFLKWKDTILEVVKKQKNVVFIYRPHPLMQDCIINDGHMTKDEYENYITELESQENAIFDKEADYRLSFYASDAIITDGTSFCIEYLYTKRPILLTPRNMNGFYMYEDMRDSYYVAEKSENIQNFVQMIADKKDPLRQKRHEFSQKLFHMQDGKTVGQNIIDNVFIELEKEEKEKGDCVE